MATPEATLQKIRLRDAKIVLCYKKLSMSVEEISAQYKLSERRIYQILSKHHAFIKRDKEWEKEKRIARLERWLKDSKNKDTRKDPLEVQAELRKEIEGESGSGGGKELQIIIIRDGQGTTNGRAENSSQPIPRQISI